MTGRSVVNSAETPSAPTLPVKPPHRLRWVVLAVVVAADAMDLMDSTIVNIAGPSIRRDLGGGTTTLQWLIAAYTLAFSVLLVTGARLGDIFGRRRLFLIGSAGFTIMSVACAVSPSPAVLIAFRALQGAFGALLIPQGFGMLKEVFADEEMSKVYAVFGPTMGLAAVIAPILAGLLISADLWGTGWRLVFLVNLPVGVFAFGAALKVLPRGATHAGVRLDVTGMTLVGLALTAIIYPLIEGRDDGWPVWIFMMLAAGVALLAVFVAYERRRRNAPLIEPGLLRNRTYMSGMAVVLSYFATYAGVLLVISLFCQLGEHFTPIHAGLTLVPMMTGMIAAMIASLRLGDRLGRHQVHIGVAVVGAGLVALALTATTTHALSTWDLAPSLFVIGLGSSLSFSQLFDIVLAGVAMNEIGSASGVLNAVEQLASALGVAVLGTVFLSRLAAHNMSTHALSTTAWVMLIPLAITFGLIFRLPIHGRANDEQVN